LFTPLFMPDSSVFCFLFLAVQGLDRQVPDPIPQAAAGSMFAQYLPHKRSTTHSLRSNT
jgi:hypothetical protein